MASFHELETRATSDSVVRIIAPCIAKIKGCKFHLLALYSLLLLIFERVDK